MTEPLHMLPLETLSEEELAREGARLDAMPENVRQVIAGFETAEFIASLALMFSLSEDQQRGVARFLMETILGGIPTGQAAPELARIAQVPLNTAVQIVKELETQLLAPLELTLSGITAPAQEPELVISEEGREGLRYASTDDLLADIAPLASDARVRFLEDAKRDNRVLVLQAMSQLKLGAGSDGRPLSFRELAAKEAAQFTARDWEDMARIDPDAFEEPGVALALERTPLGAMLLQRTNDERRTILAQFLGLDPEIRAALTGKTIQKILRSLEEGGVLPATHTPAVGRILFFQSIGKVTTSLIPGLLEKTGLSPEQSAQVAQRIQGIVPIPAAPEIAPEPAPVRPPPVQRAVPNGASRNIIDLRAGSAQKIV